MTVTMTVTITKMHEVRFNRIKLWEVFYVIIIDKSKIYEKDYLPEFSLDDGNPGMGTEQTDFGTSGGSRHERSDTTGDDSVAFGC